MIKHSQTGDEVIVGKTDEVVEKPVHHIWLRLQELYLYFWVFAGVGHYTEVLASALSLTGQWRPKMPTLTPIAPPYGFGALAAVIIVMPLKEKFKLNPVAVLLVNILVMGSVEFLCGLVITLFFGYNPFWDYSHRPDNIFGFTCGINAAAFGALAMLFEYVFYPLSEKFFKLIGPKKINWIFWILAITYAVDLLHTTFGNSWLK